MPLRNETYTPNKYSSYNICNNIKNTIFNKISIVTVNVRWYGIKY